MRSALGRERFIVMNPSHRFFIAATVSMEDRDTSRALTPVARLTP